MGYWEEILPREGGQALAQSSCGCLWIPGSVQGPAGHLGLEQPGTVSGVPAMAGAVRSLWGSLRQALSFLDPWAVDEMSCRIDDLERNIADLMMQAGVEELEGENKTPASNKG
ncbi:Heat shock factor-binding protein 1 [Turdus rufiventris]|nr:Heat shock factor-binding protein 1 [Turdus rufiventris]